jgi:endogenous inhibitor of DNA gyrase (YacG/DUF329 family)
MNKKSTKNKPLKVKCPRCKKECSYDQDNPYRPFCSQACKDHDFIKWHEEEYRVPSSPASDTDIEEAEKEDDKEKR